MRKKTSAERMWKLQEKFKDEIDLTDAEIYKASKRKLTSKIREKQKYKRNRNPKLLEEYRLKGKLKKREQQAKNKNCDNASSITQRNKWIRLKRQKNDIKELNKQAKNLELKVKMFCNENRCLKKGINNEIDTSLETDSSTSSASEILFQSVLPRTKVRAKQRLKFT